MSPESEFEKFEYKMMIIERHLDTFGHVNNATYLEILEEARWDIISNRGFGLKKIQESGQGPTILEWNIKFLKELRLRQEITIQTQAISYENKIGRMQQNILNAKGEICCETTMIFGLFDTKERRLILPTPDWMYAIGGPVAL